jgi:Domain of unknown function(DUF2779)
MPGKLLSKSRYLSGLQCKRYLWMIFNEPSRVPGPDAATQQIFDQGHRVGELAQSLFPGGINVPSDNFTENIRLTRQYLKERLPIFEAGIRAGNLFARADILKPAGDSAWDIVEVKSSTAVKDINIQDAAFQKYCYRQAGLEINRCYLLHINNKYVRRGEIDPSQLFITEDITDDVMLEIGSIPDRIEEMLVVISQKTCPDMAIGPHCKDPYDCPLTDCWEGLPEHNVFTLYRAGKKSFELYNRGITDITGIPGDYELTEKQRIQVDIIRSGKAYIDPAAVHEFLKALQYPIYYLDFETISPAIPLFEGTRPYQQIPFQFSLHVQDAPGGFVWAESFLADGLDDPRPALLAHLRQTIGNKGSVVVYNQSFEESILRELGNAFPEYSTWAESVIARLVDLIVPFRNFQYYHPGQQGSASIKHVLPAITGSGYEGLAIGNGSDASLAYFAMNYSGMPAAEKEATRAALLTYCGLDTEAMVRITKKLDDLCR